MALSMHAAISFHRLDSAWQQPFIVTVLHDMTTYHKSSLRIPISVPALLFCLVVLPEVKVKQIDELLTKIKSASWCWNSLKLA